MKYVTRLADGSEVVFTDERALATFLAGKEVANAINGLVRGMKYSQTEGMSIAKSIEKGFSDLSEAVWTSVNRIVRTR